MSPPRDGTAYILARTMRTVTARHGVDRLLKLSVAKNEILNVHALHEVHIVHVENK